MLLSYLGFGIKKREVRVEEGLVLFARELVHFAFLGFNADGDFHRIDVAICALSVCRLKHLHETLVLRSEKGSEELRILLRFCRYCVFSLPCIEWREGEDRRRHLQFKEETTFTLGGGTKHVLDTSKHFKALK